MPTIALDCGVPKASRTVFQPTTPDELPSDPSLLREMLWEVLQSNDELAQQVAFLKRALWGKKSEKLVSEDQLALFEEVKKRLGLAKGDEDGSDDSPARMPKTKAKTKRGGKRDKKRGRFIGGTVPANTPVQTTRIGLDGATCPQCGDPLCLLGTDSRKRVGFEPGHFYVNETLVETGICPKHPHQSLHTPLGPDFIVPGGVMANDLLCQVVSDKFADNLPLNKQSARFLRKGVHLRSSTLSRNVIAFATLGEHIVDAMREELFHSDWLQGDATGMPILVGDLGQAHSGHLWVYSNGESAVFEASMTKHADIPRTFLEGFQGVWLCDGASDYNAVASLPGVDRGGCWSHARRYVFDARNDNVEALIGIQMIKDLFMGERTAVLLDLEQRHAHRQKHAAPLVERIRVWVEEQRTSDHVVQRHRSAFAKAVNYLHNQWTRLTLFLDHPEIPIHNNRSELLLRGPVTGRKNWLFAGSPKGADASATLFSLTATCMLQGIDPIEYLEDVMPGLADKTKKQVAELTPARWAARRLSEKSEAAAK